MRERLSEQELQEHREKAASIAGKTYFIYMFREIESHKPIYIGRTRYVGRRMTEHRKALGDEKNYAPIYVYMRENNLQFFEDVEVVICDYVQDGALAVKREAELIEKHKDTVLNLQKIDTRQHNTDPRHKPVICITTGERFWAMKPACERYNVSRYLLRKAIENKEPISSGEYFDWLDEYVPVWKVE